MIWVIGMPFKPVQLRYGNDSSLGGSGPFEGIDIQQQMIPQLLLGQERLILRMTCVHCQYRPKSLTPQKLGAWLKTPRENPLLQQASLQYLVLNCYILSTIPIQLCVCVSICRHGSRVDDPDDNEQLHHLPFES